MWLAQGTPFHAELPPRITSIHPSVGSLAGGTELSVAGTGFGSDPAKIAIEVGGLPCDVLAVLPSGVRCQLRSREEAATAPPAAPAPTADGTGVSLGSFASERGVRWRWSAGNGTASNATASNATASNTTFGSLLLPSFADPSYCRAPRRALLPAPGVPPHMHVGSPYTRHRPLVVVLSLPSLHSHIPRSTGLLLHATAPHSRFTLHSTASLLVAGAPYVVADVPAVWELVKSDVECSSGDSNLGTFGSVQACASLTHNLLRSLSFLRALARSPSMLSALCAAVMSRAAVTVCRLAPMPPTRELGAAAAYLLSTARAPNRASVIR